MTSTNLVVSCQSGRVTGGSPHGRLCADPAPHPTSAAKQCHQGRSLSVHSGSSWKHTRWTQGPSVLCLKAPRLMGHSAQGTEREPPSSFRAPAGEPPSPPPTVAHRGGRICACGTPAAARSSSYALHGQHSHSPAQAHGTLR